jgi:hypothetical protein
LLLETRTDDANKKIDAWIDIYIFWHIFIVNDKNNKFLKYYAFVNVLWCSKLYFSPISYICPYKFLSLYMPFLLNIEWKIEICSVKIIHFININIILVVIFVILKKSLFVSFVLKWHQFFLDRKDSLKDDLFEGRHYFRDNRAVKITFMTWLTVKGDKQFVKLPKNVEFQRLRK